MTDDVAIISIVPDTQFDDSGAPVPVVVNLETGEYRPIVEPFVPEGGAYHPYGRSLVRAVQIGPFARVVNTGACLNIRLAPSLTGEVGTCAADGVLLTEVGETRDADGVTWVHVRTPAGLDGWASVNYLER
jgi:hypothetical protein